jgi:hypothetical protein
MRKGSLRPKRAKRGRKAKRIEKMKTLTGKRGEGHKGPRKVNETIR